MAGFVDHPPSPCPQSRRASPQVPWRLRRHPPRGPHSASAGGGGRSLLDPSFCAPASAPRPAAQTLFGNAGPARPGPSWTPPGSRSPAYPSPLGRSPPPSAPSNVTFPGTAPVRLAARRPSAFVRDPGREPHRPLLSLSQPLGGFATLPGPSPSLPPVPPVPSSASAHPAGVQRASRERAHVLRSS